MLSVIEQFITTNFTPEVAIGVHDLFDIIEGLTEEDFQQDYLALLMDDSEGLESTEDRFFNMMADNLDYLFLLHGVKINEETQILDRIQLIKDIVNIEDYMDRSAIMRALESSSDAVEALAGVIEITTTSAGGTDKTRLYNMLEEVKPELIETIKELCEKHDDEDTDRSEADPKLLANFKSFLTYMGEYHTLGQALTLQGVPIGAPFERYIQFIPEDTTTTKDYPLIARNILSILFMASDSYENPIKYFRDNSQLIFDDLKIITKVDTELVRLTNHYTSEIGDKSAQA